MKVFIAGATGAVGSHLIPMLLEEGHEVVGLTRSNSKAEVLERTGADAVRGDVLDEAFVKEVLAEVRPDAVVQVLNALPRGGPARYSDMDATTELRLKGTRNLVGAALATGVRRYVAESMIMGYGRPATSAAITEEQPFLKTTANPEWQPALDALNSLETQVLEGAWDNHMKAVILRMGYLYGAGVGSTEQIARMLRRRLLPVFRGVASPVSFVHIEDAARAVVASLGDQARPGVYNVVDDEPVSIAEFASELARKIHARRPLTLPRWALGVTGKFTSASLKGALPVSNAKAKETLGWSPRYPTYREGLQTMTRSA